MDIRSTLPDIRIERLPGGDEAAKFQIDRFFLLNLHRRYEAGN